MLSCATKIFKMKSLLVFMFSGLMLISCISDDHRQNNPNLLNVNVNFMVDLSLPQYSNLKFPSNSVYVGQYGNGGIILMNTGSNYVAYDAADPNHPRNDSCISMEVVGDIRLKCSCEGNTYDLFTGNFIEGEDLEYTLYPYRVTDNGNGTLRITNR